MDKILKEPRKVHCLIWFQHTYHMDHKIEPQDWYSRKAPSFGHTSFIAILVQQPLRRCVSTWHNHNHMERFLSNSWSEVACMQKKLQKIKATLPKSYTTAVSILCNCSKPSTIVEEQSKASSESTAPRGTKWSARNSDRTAAFNSTQYVLQQSFNVPVCDGTHCVTLRWKTKFDLSRIFRQNQELQEENYNLLNDIFDDHDGLLHKWHTDGTAHYNLISKLTPTEVCQYNSPSISILPLQ